jgi:hypothetical protein
MGCRLNMEVARLERCVLGHTAPLSPLTSAENSINETEYCRTRMCEMTLCHDSVPRERRPIMWLAPTQRPFAALPASHR